MDDRFGHELSQFLDGRLPSGRREQILERIQQDPEAADLLDEMERAQDLARSLPVHRVGRSFSEALWERIRSGEGTPDAVFREPLPLWIKARYVATGAAAAALLIAALQLAAGRAQDPEGAVGTPVEVARGDAPPAESRLRPADPGLFPALPIAALDPGRVAQAGQVECVDAVATLQHRAPELERRIPAVGPRDLVVELGPVVGRARGSAELIRWLQRERMVKLGTEFDTTLTLTERILERLARADQQNDPTLLRLAVEDLRELRLDGLRQKFDVVCCTEPHEFLSDLSDQIRRNPEVGRSLRIVVTTGAPGLPTDMLLRRLDPFGTDPFGGPVLLLRDPWNSGTFQLQGQGGTRVEVHVERGAAGSEPGPDAVRGLRQR